MNSSIDLNELNADELRALAAQLMTQVAEKDELIRFKEERNAQLTPEISCETMQRVRASISARQFMV